MITLTNPLLIQGKNTDDNLTIATLTSYRDFISNSNNKLVCKEIKTSYFIENNVWNIEFFSNISQFKDKIKGWKKSNNIQFNFINNNLNLELKYIWYKKIFNEEWALSTAFVFQATQLKKFAIFINENYPEINSFIEMDIELIERHWYLWLSKKGYKVQQKNTYIEKTALANFARVLYTYFWNFTDTRNEWEKDRWDIRILNRDFGINYNKSNNTYYISFKKIENIHY